jgi:Protein of unknown function (DUF2877)
MLDAVAPTTLRATLVGQLAAPTLHGGARGEVRAVFERSFYVWLDAGWICAGPASLGAGPLNVLCDPWPADQLNLILQAGDAARVENGYLRAGSISIVLDAAQNWRPEPPRSWCRTSLARGLAAFSDALPAILPKDGLARLLRPERAAIIPTPVLASAQAPTRYLANLIAAPGPNALTVDAERIVPLIGLGPGLTPSGDDYLGGVLVALALTDRAAMRDRLWHALQPHLAANTGDISRTHLAAAAEGFGSAAMHELLAAILTGDTKAVPDALAAVAVIGHTSGWDALAGAVSALRGPA